MRIVLAYSGSLEGSAAIAWLRERTGAEVVTVTLDLGQGRELEAIRDRALALGAQRAHVLDTRDQFAQEFILPALRADALHAGGVPMAMALSRPLIALTLVDIAGIERADAVAHTGHAGDGVSRLDVLLADLAPSLPVRTPAREWSLGPAELAAFARAHGIGYPGDDASRVESNFWGRSLRRQPGIAGASDLPERTLDADPAEPAVVEITFTRGVPTALNGVPLPLPELAASLGTLARTHGVGRTASDTLLCDAPAAVLLHAGHRALARVASDPELDGFSTAATAAYVDLVERARWFASLRPALDAYFGVVQSRINGRVRLHLFKGAYSTITTELTQPVAGVPLRVLSNSVQH